MRDVVDRANRRRRRELIGRPEGPERGIGCAPADRGYVMFQLVDYDLRRRGFDVRPTAWIWTDEANLVDLEEVR